MKYNEDGTIEYDPELLPKTTLSEIHLKCPCPTCIEKAKQEERTKWKEAVQKLKEEIKNLCPEKDLCSECQMIINIIDKIFGELANE